MASEEGGGRVTATEESLGCESCLQGDAARAWEARPFQVIAVLIDDSHFRVDIRACPACGQRWVHVSTEFVDRQGGDDAQYWSEIPTTDQEAAELIPQGDGVDVKLIERIGQNRRWLHVDHPSGGERRVHWSVGPVWIMPGD